MKKTKERMRELLTVKDVAAVCQVSTDTVMRWIREDQLTAIRLSRQTFRIRESDLQTFLRARRTLKQRK